MIDVEFVQTGEKTSVSTLEEAQEWMKSVGSATSVGEEKSTRSES